jgi:IS5 family transposase
MTRWRKMFGEGGMEKLLSGTIAVGFEMKAITGKSLENVNIDATVQEKAITYLQHQVKKSPRLFSTYIE